MIVIEVEGVRGRQEKELVEIVEHGMRYSSWRLAWTTTLYCPCSISGVQVGTGSLCTWLAVGLVLVCTADIVSSGSFWAGVHILAVRSADPLTIH